MNCLEFSECLQLLLDGAAKPLPQAAVHHAAECSACRSLHAAARSLADGMRLLAKPPLAPLLTQSIVAGVLDDHRQRTRALRRRLAITVGLAASLLLVVLIRWPDPRPQPNHVVRNDPPAAPQLARSADDARLAVAALTERVADQTKEQAKMLIAAANAIDLAPMPSFPALIDLEQPLDPAAQSLRQATETVASGIEPVTNSARRAFQFFVNELPGLDIP